MSNLKILNARSLELGASAKTLGVEIHKHCLNIMAHVQTASGDVSAADVLIRALSPVGKDKSKNVGVVRADAVKQWLKDFAFVSFSKDEKTGKVSAKLNKKAFKEAAADDFKAHNRAAKVQPWNKYKPAENEVGAFDVDKAIQSAFDAIEKKIDEARLGTGKFERQTAEKRAANKLESARLDAFRDAMKAVA